ncbi:hypothetical protein BDV41DRAFT_569084 [Aspergillus transmontanensis]|uniref:Uncharacterized protein n=1 Tax=Aspergillus transmontanensis TaxID=1034304 RepID=A0A5N6VGZ5_9EURO|nr:hypothetical protein BDV41DRAFT_569084 [Aspergillus transmontanensis]
MLPPSDSLLHQLQKLAEARAAAQYQTRASPPPPYSRRNAPDLALAENDLIDSDGPKDADDGDEYMSWGSGSSNGSRHHHAPVSIHIDASINVRGNGPQQGNGPTAPSSLPSSTMHQQQSAQRHRQTKLTDMVTSIITALGRASLLPSTEDGSSPVEININSGIKIEGSRNVICTGNSLPSGRSLAKRQYVQIGGVGSLYERDRTRRADSVRPSSLAQGVTNALHTGATRDTPLKKILIVDL